MRYEIDLYRQGRMSALIVAATLIMANKQIDQSTFQELWEEMKMLGIGNEELSTKNLSARWCVMRKTASLNFRTPDNLFVES